MKPCLLMMLLAAVAFPQAKAPSRGAHRMEITLERRENGAWKAVDPGLVLTANDNVRFRFRSNFDGYLFVKNHGSSGGDVLLFPSEDAGTSNRVRAGREYVIPNGTGHFRVTGPAGYDMIAWIVSPTEFDGKDYLSKGAAITDSDTAPVQGSSGVSLPDSSTPVDLKPRCDTSVLKARGDCVDTAAGLQANAHDGKSRELIFIREKQAAVVASPTPLSGPVVYTFRLAHK